MGRPSRSPTDPELGGQSAARRRRRLRRAAQHRFLTPDAAGPYGARVDASAARSRRGSARLLVAILLLAAGLRVYPLHVAYEHPDQFLVPDVAMRSIGEETWRPANLLYPTGLMETLRVLYLAGYAGARSLHRVADRTDWVALYLENPQPFLAAARAWACLAGTATVALAFLLAGRLFPRPAGVLAALFLAVSFLHVRESHYGHVDAPAVLFFVAALWAAERYRGDGRLKSLVGAAALTGAAAGHRYQLAVAALALAVAELARRGQDVRVAVRHLALAAATALATFAVLSPYTLLEPGRAIAQLRWQVAFGYFPTRNALPLREILPLACGWPVCALALLGVAVALRRRTTTAALLLAPLVPYVIAIAGAWRVYARYLLPLVPLVAVFGAGGAVALCARLAGRARSIAIVALALATIADPLARSTALDRLLARTDTRELAGRWLLRHVRPGELVLRGNGYAEPRLPPDFAKAALRVGVPLATKLRQRGRGLLPFAVLDDPAKPGAERARWVVTSDHPGIPAWAKTSDAMASFAERSAEPAVRFVGTADAGSAVYERIDATFVPLRGFGVAERPGPNIAIWQVVRPPLAVQRGR